MKKAALFIPLFIVAVFLLAACGGGGGGSKPEPREEASPCDSCHGEIAAAMGTALVYHHAMENFDVTSLGSSKYPTSPQPPVGSEQRRCLACHADHDVFDPEKNPSNGARASNLRESVRAVPDKTSGFTNVDFSEGLADGGICLSCHIKSQAKGAIQPDGSTATGEIPFPPSVGNQVAAFAASAHNYQVESRFLSDDSLFLANCVKCHNSLIEGDSFQNSVAPNRFSLHNTDYRRLLVAANTTSADPLEEEFCFLCHGAGGEYYGSAGRTPDDIESVFTSKAVSHPVTDATMRGRHTPVEGDAYGWNPTASRHVECEDCHNPHAASASDPLAGVWGVMANYTGIASGEPPAYEKSFSAVNEAGICLKCHSEYAWNSLSPPLVPSGPFDAGTSNSPASNSWPYSQEETDVGADFNPNNMAYHPVMVEGKNQPPITSNPAWKTSASPDCDPGVIGQWPCKVKGNKKSTYGPGLANPDQGLDNTFVDGWGSRSLVTCSDCHASDVAGDPKGAHGSSNPWLLKGLDRNVTVTLVNGTEVQVNSSLPASFESYFCYNCHRADVYAIDFMPDSPMSDRGTNSIWADNDDYYPGLSRVPHPPDGRSDSFNWPGIWGIGCMNCHGGNTHGGIHGSNMDNRAHQGADAQGVRFLNGSTLIGVTRARVTAGVSCWTKSSSDTVSSCAHSHVGTSGNYATYEY